MPVFAIDIVIDEPVEFVSAVARLADYDEYKNDVNKAYVDELDSVMSSFKNHEAVGYLKNARGSQNIGFDAIATVAVHSEVRDGKLALCAGASLNSADSRWKQGQEKELFPLLNDLYQKSNFHEFFLKNHDFYSKVIDNAQACQSAVDYDWLSSFYGKPLLGTKIIVSLLNNGNYGPTKTINGEPEEAFMIIGCDELDENNVPRFGNKASLIIHESSHPVCNPLIQNNLSGFNGNIELVAELMKDELASQSYSGAYTMMCESMVRAVCILYDMRHATSVQDSINAANWMRSEMAKGYVFLPEIINVYESIHSTIDELMPAIIDAVNNVDVGERYSEIKNGSPKIIGCSIEEGIRDVKPSDEFEIKVFFDQPVSRSFGMALLDGNEEILPDLADCPGRIQWDESNRILSFKIMAKPNSEIGFKVLGAFFRGSKGYRGNGEAVIHFFTGN